LVVAFFLVQATPLEILVAACAAGEIAAVVATSSAASATEVLRNILSSIFEFRFSAESAMTQSYWAESEF
jgi:hypothetical protein